MGETTKWHKLFESFCFKSKYIIERQSSLLKKLQVENNIIKNERNQLHENNKRLITKLPPKSPDVKRMKQMKMDFYSPAKNNPAGAASPQKQPVSPSHSSRPTKSPAQSPFKMPKSPRSSQA